ncbi:MAG: signal transduction protein [Neobacillus sp.]|nr:signal transduction protein [Neobacillus sp.]
MMDQNQFNLEIFDAVRFHPFFKGVDPNTASFLLSLCELRQYEKTEMILEKDKPRDGLLLMLEGFSEVFVRNETHGKEEVLEVVQKGEIIGFSSLAYFLGMPRPSSSEVMVEVKAVTLVKVLFIPFEVIKKRWDDPTVHDYLLTQVSVRLKDVYTSLAEQVKLARDYGDQEVLMVRVQDIMSEKIVSVTPVTTIQEAARLMHEMKTSSVLVIENEILQGIITERDMVKRVVAEGMNLTASSIEMMTPNPISISPTAYYYDALHLVFINGIKHIPVVEKSKVVGIITLSDLLRKKSENVMRTIKQIDQVDKDSLPQVKGAIYEVIDTLLRNQIPIFKTFDIVTKLYDRLVIRLIELSFQTLKDKGKLQPCSFAFYQMGSSGREEQFMLTDQDHFLVYENDSEQTTNYFTELGKEITLNMEKSGYARCKGLMMCSEAKWRGSLAVWEERLRYWMLQSTNDHLLLAQNFFSYRFITGSRKLHERFEGILSNQLQRSKIFLYRMTQIESEHPIPTLDQPIRSLFKLERKNFDIKKEVLFPYHHCLQILSLLNGKQSGAPLEKISWLQEKGVFSDAFAKDLEAASSHILTMYVKQRWQQLRSGKEQTSIVSFTKLSTREKEELIISLRTLRELQGQVLSHFNL